MQRSAPASRRSQLRCFDDKFQARPQLRTEERQHGKTKAAGGAGAGSHCFGELAGVLGQPAKVGIELFHLGGRRAFLGTVNARRTVRAEKRVGHIAGDGDGHPLDSNSRGRA